MKLVENWKNAWRWWSMRFMAMAVAWPIIWTQMPPDAKAMIPTSLEGWIPISLIVAAMISRPVQQGN